MGFSEDLKDCMNNIEMNSNLKNKVMDIDAAEKSATRRKVQVRRSNMGRAVAFAMSFALVVGITAFAVVSNLGGNSKNSKNAQNTRNTESEKAWDVEYETEELKKVCVEKHYNPDCRRIDKTAEIREDGKSALITYAICDWVGEQEIAPVYYLTFDTKTNKVEGRTDRYGRSEYGTKLVVKSNEDWENFYLILDVHSDYFAVNEGVSFEEETLENKVKMVERVSCFLGVLLGAYVDGPEELGLGTLEVSGGIGVFKFEFPLENKTDVALNMECDSSDFVEKIELSDDREEAIGKVEETDKGDHKAISKYINYGSEGNDVWNICVYEEYDAEGRLYCYGTDFDMGSGMRLTYNFRNSKGEIVYAYRLSGFNDALDGPFDGYNPGIGYVLAGADVAKYGDTLVVRDINDADQESFEMKLDIYDEYVNPELDTRRDYEAFLKLRGVLGKSVGDIFEMEAPDGTNHSFQILEMK